MVRDKCFKKLCYRCGILLVSCVSRLLLLCVQQHGQSVSCVLFGRNTCPVLTLDWVIFLQLGFLPWCSLPACAPLALQQCCHSHFQHHYTVSLFLPHWRRGWGRIEGSWVVGLKQGTWIYSTSATKRNLFVSFPFSMLADLEKFKPFLNAPQCS